MNDWKKALDAEVRSLGLTDQDRRDFLTENLLSVGKVVADDGARIVFNMACKHVPGFCDDSARGPDAYLNAYRLGPSRTRVAVDEALEQCAAAAGTALRKEDISFGAVETSGTGIRFYGDMCLVMKPPADVDDFLVVDRNSYDVTRNPIAQRVQSAMAAGDTEAKARVGQMSRWLGRWADVAHMLAMKVMRRLPIGNRRWTTGQVAQVILEDEDYCEVLYPRSFNARDLSEVRVSAADAAAETDIAQREQAGDAPAIHELEWRNQRREARRALARARVPVRIVTTPGRIKSS